MAEEIRSITIEIDVHTNKQNVVVRRDVKTLDEIKDIVDDVKIMVED